MILKQIKLTSSSKDKLSRLKSKTGIQNWNVLCRIALCYSLAEYTLPTDLEIDHDSNVEMSWYTFGGEYCDLYEALMIAWCKKMGLDTDPDTLKKYFELNLKRGIEHISGTSLVKSLDDLLNLIAPMED